MGSRTYNTIDGFFVQDDINSIQISAIPPRLGLLDDTPERWSKFIDHINRLNQALDQYTNIKVMFFSRHGEGFHNVAEAKYGTRAWDGHWAKLNGDGEIVWGPDPELTYIGIGQAVIANEAWRAELPFGVPLPQKLFSSPLTRALKTCEITFKGILPDGLRRTIVVENCREENGIHTCDRRRTLTYIAEAFPQFEIETGFTEDDTLWDPSVRESRTHVNERARLFLGKIFDDHPETFISVTAHGGIINGFLSALGRPPYLLPTGGILPVVVKSTRTP